jgi:DNA repair protein Rad10
VSRRQEGNPVLRHIRSVRWQYGDIVPDYMLGGATAAVFLSLRYHLLRPDYIHARLKELGRGFRLRVVLVQVRGRLPSRAHPGSSLTASGTVNVPCCHLSEQSTPRGMTENPKNPKWQ